MIIILLLILYYLYLTYLISGVTFIKVYAP